MKKINTISIKMSMTQNMHSLIRLLEQGTEQGKKIARTELLKIAGKIDSHNKMVAINNLRDFLVDTIKVLAANPDIDTSYPVDYESNLCDLCSKADYNWEIEETSNSIGIEKFSPVEIYTHFLEDVIPVLETRLEAVLEH